MNQVPFKECIASFLMKKRRVAYQKTPSGLFPTWLNEKILLVSVRVTADAPHGVEFAPKISLVRFNKHYHYRCMTQLVVITT